MSYSLLTLNGYELMKDSGFHPVLAAAIIAFSFVIIHPLEDGNGRIHRYLIHHVLAESGFTPKGVIFPRISSHSRKNRRVQSRVRAVYTTTFEVC